MLVSKNKRAWDRIKADPRLLAEHNAKKREQYKSRAAQAFRSIGEWWRRIRHDNSLFAITLMNKAAVEVAEVYVVGQRERYCVNCGNVKPDYLPFCYECCSIIE